MHTQCNRSGFARENSTFCRTGRSASTRARSNAYVHTELQCKHRHAVSLRKINSEFSWTLFGHFSPNRARPHVFSISAGCLECKQKTETGSLMRLFFSCSEKGPGSDSLSLCLQSPVRTLFWLRTAVPSDWCHCNQGTGFIPVQKLRGLQRPGCCADEDKIKKMYLIWTKGSQTSSSGTISN